jgi:hypothetical protein
MPLAKPSDQAFIYLPQLNLPASQPPAEVQRYRQVMLHTPQGISLPNQIPHEPL